MKSVIARAAGDFFSTILFVVIWVATDDVAIATVVAVVGAIGQFFWAKRMGYAMNAVSWVGLALIVLLGGGFVLIKPSLGHFAVGSLMLKRGWMGRYMPPRVMETAPDLPVVAGYCWAALMLSTGAGVVATALTGDAKLWGVFVFGVAPAAKVVAMAAQYATFRVVIGRRIAAAARANQP